MEFLVLFVTICCLVCAAIYFQERLRNGGRRFSLRPSDRARYLECVEELRNSIDEFSDDCEISNEQCQLLRSECLRLVKPTPPHPTLKESFCAIRRALKLMKDCCSEHWLLKAVEFGNCRGHFLEILLDLHRLPIVVDLIGFRGKSLHAIGAEFRSIGISEETKSKIDGAWNSDTATLRRKLESEIRERDQWLADQLKEKPSLTIAPDVIGSYVTQFDIPSSPYIYKGSLGIYILPATFRNKKFAIKTRFMRIEPGAEEPEEIQLQNEAFLMKKCRHPYAVALLGYWPAVRTDGPRRPLLLMEFMESDLKDVIERNKRDGTGGFPALVAINLVLPVAKVMKYLHGIRVVHLDLKPENILFTRVPGTQDRPEEISVKLADFGDARMAEDEVTNTGGTWGYRDPALRVGVDLVKAADVFSFGMVFGEVLTGLSPPDALGCEYPTKFYGELQRGKRPSLPEETPRFVKSIVESCWDPNPGVRPSFDDICWQLQNTEILLRNGNHF